MSHLKVEITEPAVKKTSQKGNEYTTQSAFVHLGEKYPRSFEFFVRQGGYNPGIYALDLAKSVEVRNERLQLGDLVLQPANEAK